MRPTRSASVLYRNPLIITKTVHRNFHLVNLSSGQLIILFCLVNVNSGIPFPCNECNICSIVYSLFLATASP